MRRATTSELDDAGGGRQGQGGDVGRGVEDRIATNCTCRFFCGFFRDALALWEEVVSLISGEDYDELATPLAMISGYIHSQRIRVDESFCSY